MLTKTERLRYALEGKSVDKIPFSVWPHYPVSDLFPQILAKKQVEDALEFDFDFIKVASHGLFSVLDYGTTYRKSISGLPFVDKYGTLQIESYGVKSIEDWKKLKILSPHGNTFASIIHTIDSMNELLKGYRIKIPIIATVYSPLTTAYKLAGPRLLEDMKKHPEIIHTALKTLTQTTINYIKECILFGVVGFFFASQLSTKDILTKEDYKDFGVPYDLELFKNFGHQTYFNVVHIHGKSAFLDLLLDYPAHCFNWHDRWTGPQIPEMRKLTNKCLMGGLDEERVLGKATVDELKLHIQEALQMGGPKKFILSPGCTAYPETPKIHLRQIKNSIYAWKPNVS